MFTDKTQLGSRIRSRRKSLKLTQKALAEKLNISQGYIADLENSKINNPSLEKITYIAKELNLPLTDLFSDGFTYDVCKEVKKTQSYLSEVKVSPLEPSITSAVNYVIDELSKSLHMPLTANSAVLRTKLRRNYTVGEDYKEKCLKLVARTLKSVKPVPIFNIYSLTSRESLRNVDNIVDIEFLRTPIQPKPDFYVKAFDNSMIEADVYAGSIIPVSHCASVEHGKMHVVLLKEEKHALIREIKFLKDEILLIPKSSDPAFETIKADVHKVIVLGKVID